MWSPSRQRIKREARRRSAFYCRMDATACASVLIGLLFVAAPEMQPRIISDGIPVGLVKSAYATPQRGALRENALRILIADDGKIYLGNREVEPESVSEAIRENVRRGAPRTIYLSIDGRARFFDINPLLDQIQASGVRDVVLLTQPRQE